MIIKTNVWYIKNFFYFTQSYTLYYIYWLLKITNKKYLYYDLRNIKYYLWKRLIKFQMYPKDIKYYYRLYYATKNLTWFYSLRKFRKVRRFRIFNYLKFSNALTLKKTISKYFESLFYNHVPRKFVRSKNPDFAIVQHVSYKRQN